jgi:catechol 2,3-dioxygenase-like lactoylglutathione lyase family enzyme/predicted enzyme related to lactoylglutathione lyase
MATRLPIALLLLLCAKAMFAQTESPAVVGVGPFLHIVSDLDQSLAFYHDTLGLELTGPPGEHKFTDNPAVANLYGVPGKQFRAAVLKIPGSQMGIELVQWGEARKPKDGPTAVTLMLGRPGAVRTTLRDPDGFTVEVDPSVIAGAALVIGVNDARKAAALYESMLGLKSDQIRFTTAGNKGLNVPFPTPGQGMLRLFVRNIDAVTASLKAAGSSVITTSGAPVTLPQGQRVIIIRDPNGFYLQPMEMR